MKLLLALLAAGITFGFASSPPPPPPHAFFPLADDGADVWVEELDAGYVISGEVQP